jgi:hypothetical protein
MTEYLIVVVAVAAAALCFGLWLGERGRRKDLAWLVHKDRERGMAATVTPPPDGEAHAAEIMGAEDRQRMIDDTIAKTGCTLKEAQEDVDQMLMQLARQSTDGW